MSVNSVVVVVSELVQFSVQGGGNGAGGMFTSPAATGKASIRTIKAAQNRLRIWENPLLSIRYGKG